MGYGPWSDPWGPKPDSCPGVTRNCLNLKNPKTRTRWGSRITSRSRARGQRGTRPDPCTRPEAGRPGTQQAGRLHPPALHPTHACALPRGHQWAPPLLTTGVPLPCVSYADSRAVPVRATAPHRTQLPSALRLCCNMTGTACAGPATRKVFPAGRYDQGGVLIDAWPVA
jgi:hypothetical protein